MKVFLILKIKEGTIHHPELFEATVKGYHVDTTDFVINTGHNRRSREGNHNHWRFITIKL